MATTKITNPELFDLGSLNTALQLPSGTTAERPASPSTGEWRYNTDNNLIEFYDGGSWRDLQSEDLPVVPSEHFNTVVYSGTGGSQSITGVGFQPDWIWIKNVNDTNSYIVQDSTRGAGKTLFSNLQNPEDGTSGDLIASFDSDGFTVNENFNGSTTNESTNKSGNIYVAWCWKANGGTTTAGTGTGGVSSVTHQLNDKGGFCITKFTSGSSAGGTVTHGLDSAPDLIFMKATSSTQSWWVWSSTFADGNQYLQLQSTAVQGSSSNVWNSTAPSASVVTLGAWNSQSFDYIMYAFKSVAGYSSFGSYTGNGTTNGPIINTGFEPARLMIKRTDSADAWYIYDNKRNSSNPRNSQLMANTSDAQLTNTEYYSVDFLSNGFQPRSALSTATNANGGSYIYMAFASDASAAPVVEDSFGIETWSGDNSLTRAISGYGFEPSFAWIKWRSGSYAHSHILFTNLINLSSADSALSSNSNGPLIGYKLYEFTVDGFQLASPINATNESGFTMVGWAWKANPMPSINTEGTIQSIVSANQAAGFSIVKYTGNATNDATVGHGLSQAPELWIGKQITGSSINWQVLYSGFAEGDYLSLNLINAKANSANVSFDPTATTVKFQGGQALNDTQQNIGYAFHSVDGFSKVGTYAGNGTSQSVTLGFEPTFLMLRKYDDNQDWFMFDSVRDPSNPKTKRLLANSANGEATLTTDIDFTSTGFDLTSSSFNDSGKNFLYLCFKENPSTPAAIPSGEVAYLVVGAGGGGGGVGGGAGAGGLRTSYGNYTGGGQSAESNITLSAQTYTITIGAGGTASATGGTWNYDGNTGSNGTSSVFGTITSVGGGGGTGGSNRALSGGSGGGARFLANGQGQGVSGQGFDGATGDIGGGGGGAAGVGGSSTSGSCGADGGPGLNVPITGATTYYAGGGGGGASLASGCSGTSGGVGGGGNSGANNGTANTGGGGGGGNWTNNGNVPDQAGGNGGSGVVILRMNTSDYSGTTTGSPTVTTVGSETILTYTGSGTYVHS